MAEAQCEFCKKYLVYKSDDGTPITNHMQVKTHVIDGNFITCWAHNECFAKTVEEELKPAIKFGSYSIYHTVIETIRKHMSPNR